MKSLPRAAAVPVIVAILTLAPFLDKAFTIDDTVFLFQAKHALEDPLHPSAFSIAWNRDIPERVSTMVPSGPVAAWLLVPSVMAGGSEWVAHAMQIVMLALAALATVSIGTRLGLTAGWATMAGATLVATPVTLGMAGTAMPDVPAMALGIFGIERLIAWRDDRRWHQAISGAVLLALASLARSHLFVLLLLGPLLLAGDSLLRSDRIRSTARLLWPFAFAAVLAAAIMILTRDPNPGGDGIAGAAVSLSGIERIPLNAISFATNWVLATTFTLSWVALRRETMARRWWIFVLSSTALRRTAVVQTRRRGDLLGGPDRGSRPRGAARRVCSTRPNGATACSLCSARGCSCRRPSSSTRTSRRSTSSRRRRRRASSSPGSRSERRAPASGSPAPPRARVSCSALAILRADANFAEVARIGDPAARDRRRPWRDARSGTTATGDSSGTRKQRDGSRLDGHG